MIKLKTIIKIALIFTSTMSFSQVLVKLQYNNLQYSGHGVSMYYSAEDIDELYYKIKKLKTLTIERKVLNSFGLPLSDYGEGKCIEKGIPINDIDILFEENIFDIKIQSLNFNLSVSLVKADYEICRFDATVSHWGSYDTNFKRIGIISSYPVKKNFSKEDLCLLEKIRVKFEKLCR